MVVRIDAQDFEIAHGDTIATHPTRRPHPLDDARGVRRGTDRPRRAVEHRTVSRRASAKVVAPDHTLVPFSAAGPDHVHALAVDKDRSQHLLTHLGGFGAGGYPNLTPDARWGNPGLLVVTGDRFADLGGTLLDQPELHGQVSVGLRRLGLHDHTWPRFD